MICLKVFKVENFFKFIIFRAIGIPEEVHLSVDMLPGTELAYMYSSSRKPSRRAPRFLTTIGRVVENFCSGGGAV